jgi:hypothetical protein
LSRQTPRPPNTAQGQPPRLLVTVVPYTLLAVLVVFTVIAKRSAGGSLLIDLGLCGLTTAWMLFMFTLRPAWWDRPLIMGVFFAGLVVMTAILVMRVPSSGLFTPAVYIYASTIFPWPWRLPVWANVALANWEHGAGQRFSGRRRGRRACGLFG